MTTQENPNEGAKGRRFRIEFGILGLLVLIAVAIVLFSQGNVAPSNTPSSTLTNSSITSPKPTYFLRVLPSPVYGGSVYGAGNYLGGTTVAVSAKPIKGFNFTGWGCSGADCYAGLNSSFEITVNNNLLEIANFMKYYPANAYSYATAEAYPLTQGYNYGELFLPKNYTYYICGGSSASPSPGWAPGVVNASWKQSASVAGYSSIGIQNSSTCILHTNSSAQNAALVGLAIRRYQYAQYGTASHTLTFNVSENDSLVVAIIAGQAHLGGNSTLNQNLPGPSIQYPQGSDCNMAGSPAGYLGGSVASLFICNPAQPGPYKLLPANVSDSSIAAYVFYNSS